MNVNKLKGKIVEKEMSVAAFAKKLGVDRATMYRRLQDGGATFTIKEVKEICRLLELSGTEATEIFLPFMSHDMRQ